MRLDQALPPLTYGDIRTKIKEKKPDIKFGKSFHKAMKRIEQDKKLCRTNYLDPKRKNGSSKKFYEEDAIDMAIKFYDEEISL